MVERTTASSTRGDDRGKTVYLNVATSDELMGLGLSDQDAAAIIDARPYSTWADVKLARGFEDDRLNELKARGVELGAPSAGPIGEPGSGGSGGAPPGNLGQA